MEELHPDRLESPEPAPALTRRRKRGEGGLGKRGGSRRFDRRWRRRSADFLAATVESEVREEDSRIMKGVLLLFLRDGVEEIRAWSEDGGA